MTTTPRKRHLKEEPKEVIPLRNVSRQELEDMVQGGIVLGCGGGGDVEISRQLVEQIVSLNTELTMASLDEIPDDAVVAVISGMGSPMATKKKGFDLEQCVKAADYLEQFTGLKLTHVVAVETGGGNFLPPVYVAARKGIPFLDADGVGRAIPEMQMTMYHLRGMPSSPTVLTDIDGVSVLICDADAHLSERIGRAVVTEMGGAAGCVSHPMGGAAVKSAVIPGTYTRAQQVGLAIREAKNKGEDPVAAAVRAMEGVELIRGDLIELKIETVRSHDLGFALVRGTGQYSNKMYKIAFKNENMVVWDEAGKPLVVSPDLPCIMGADGTPLTNADLEQGMKVAVIGAKCHPRWRSEDGIRVFQQVLADLGYTGPYIPFEEL